MGGNGPGWATSQGRVACQSRMAVRSSVFGTSHLPAVIRVANGLTSSAMIERPDARASTAAVPHPQNGSRTVSPDSEKAWMAVAGISGMNFRGPRVQIVREVPFRRVCEGPVGRSNQVQSIQTQTVVQGRRGLRLGYLHRSNTRHTRQVLKPETSATANARDVSPALPMRLIVAKRADGPGGFGSPGSRAASAGGWPPTAAGQPRPMPSSSPGS